MFKRHFSFFSRFLNKSPETINLVKGSFEIVIILSVIGKSVSIKSCVARCRWIRSVSDAGCGGLGKTSGVQVYPRPRRSHGFLGSRRLILCDTSGVGAESATAGVIVGRSLVGCIADTILRSKRGSGTPTYVENMRVKIAV